MMKEQIINILYTSKEAFNKARKFFELYQYEWTYVKQNNSYLVTIFY